MCKKYEEEKATYEEQIAQLRQQIEQQAGAHGSVNGMAVDGNADTSDNGEFAF